MFLYNRRFIQKLAYSGNVGRKVSFRHNPQYQCILKLLFHIQSVTACQIT